MDHLQKNQDERDKEIDRIDWFEEEDEKGNRFRIYLKIIHRCRYDILG